MAAAFAKLVCQACGRETGADEPLPFRCLNQMAGDDCDHLLLWQGREPLNTHGEDLNPFIAFRGHSFSYARWIERGQSDQGYVDLVRELDGAIAALDKGFSTTPWLTADALGVSFKDETQNVAGSHKARHLFGILLAVEVAERTGLLPAGQVGTPDSPLAIASCGNAALAAALLARAWKRKLRVFIPTWADQRVMHELKQLDAEVVSCERDATDLGDPCVHAFRNAVAAGALPFTCQGPENGINIDGGKTLGFELARSLLAADVPQLEHLFIQVGGGALASGTIQALGQMLPPARAMPAIHAVQTDGCAPLIDAWRLLARDLQQELGGDGTDEMHGDNAALARWLIENANPAASDRIFQRALRERSRYMRPVKSPVPSVASGILDNETYDWFVVVRAMIESGGWPVQVTEEALKSARDAARQEAQVNVDATGAAGLAGVRSARQAGLLSDDTSVGVLFTGVLR